MKNEIGVYSHVILSLMPLNYVNYRLPCDVPKVCTVFVGFLEVTGYIFVLGWEIIFVAVYLN